MRATATVAPGPAAPERAGYAGAGPSRQPHAGPAGDRATAGVTQPAAAPRPGVQAGTTDVPGEVSARALPGAENVLAVIARHGQESADLGAILHVFRRRGARLSLLCLTRGEASPLNSTCERLETIRPFELQVAAGLLGVSSVMVAAPYVEPGEGRSAGEQGSGRGQGSSRRTSQRGLPPRRPAVWRTRLNLCASKSWTVPT